MTEAYLAQIETFVQAIREQLAGHSRRDAVNTCRESENFQPPVLHLGTAARMLETRL